MISTTLVSPEQFLSGATGLVAAHREPTRGDNHRGIISTKRFHLHQLPHRLHVEAAIVFVLELGAEIFSKTQGLCPLLKHTEVNTLTD